MTTVLLSTIQPAHIVTIETSFGQPGVALARAIDTVLSSFGMGLAPIPNTKRFIVLNSRTHQIELVSQLLAQTLSQPSLKQTIGPLRPEVSLLTDAGEVTIKFYEPAVRFIPPEHY